MKNRGITLIALVVTIVILLILAAVSISMLIGENGVVKQAQQAKYGTKIADEKERVELAATAAKTENVWGEIREDNLEKELTKNIGERNVDYTLEQKGDKFIVTYTDTENSYLVDADGKTTKRGPWAQGDKNENGNIPITNGKITLEVGDIIKNYNPVIEGEEARTVTSYSTENGDSDQIFSSEYTGTWKVLGVSDEGQVLITSTDVIKTTLNRNYYLMGQRGYKNVVSELDKISEIFGYGYGATGARSIRVEDINKVTGYNPNNVGVCDSNQKDNGTKYGEGQLEEYGNEVTYYWKGDALPHYTSTNGVEGNLGTHSIFCWFDRNIKTLKSSSKAMISPPATEISGMQKIITLKSDYYYYYPQTLTSRSNSYATTGLKTGSKAYNAIFTDSSGNTDDYYYWIGSPYVGTRGVLDFGVRFVVYGGVGFRSLILSDATFKTDSGGVRPVVILKSDIQLTGNSTDGWEIEKD